MAAKTLTHIQTCSHMIRLTIQLLALYNPLTNIQIFVHGIERGLKQDIRSMSVSNYFFRQDIWWSSQDSSDIREISF